MYGKKSSASSISSFVPYNPSFSLSPNISTSKVWTFFYLPETEFITYKIVLSEPNLMLDSITTRNILQWAYISYISEKYVWQTSEIVLVWCCKRCSSVYLFFLLVSDRPPSNLNYLLTILSLSLAFSLNSWKGVNFFFSLFGTLGSWSSCSWSSYSTLS